MAAVVGQLAESMGRLLVVEGDLVQRTVIGRIGANLGYDTAFASSFEAAAGLLRHESFDVMTIDLSLGTRDGIELLRLAADLGLHTMQIVIISSCDERVLNSAKRVADGFGLPLNGCMTKPLNLDRLKEALHLPRAKRIAGSSDAPSLDLTRESIVAALARKEFPWSSSRRWSFAPERSSEPRRLPAGGLPNWVWFRQPSSFRWPSNSASCRN